MKRIIILFACTLLTFFSVVSFGTGSAFANANSDSINKGLSYLRKQQSSNGKFNGFDSSVSKFDGISSWTAMAFEASNIDINTVNTNGGKSLLSFLELSSPIASDSATDWERRIFAIVGAGKDPGNFNQTDYLAGLKKYYNNGQIGNLNQINDDTFGLLALIAGKEDSSETLIADTLSFILSHQNNDGGFSYLTKGVSDIDDTAVALMSLVAAKNYRINSNGLDQSINDAKNYMLSHQNCDGGFPYDPNPATAYNSNTSSNLDSTAWALMAFSSLDMYSSQQGINAQMFLRGLQQSDGSFPLNLNSAFGPIQGDSFDTSYAVTALSGAFWPIIKANEVMGTVADTASTLCPSPTLNLAQTPTPTPTVVSESIQTPQETPTATPTAMPSLTPEVTVPTIAPTSVPTNMIIPTQAIRLIGILKTPTPTPTSTVIQEILGANAVKNGYINEEQTLMYFFLGTGTVSLIILFLKFFKRKKEK